MGYTLGEAARATGLNKTTVLKAIRRGVISATKDDLGQWCIEPCELHRVYPARSEDNGSGNGLGNDGQPTDNPLQHALALAEARLGDLKAMLDDMRAATRRHARAKGRMSARSLAAGISARSPSRSRRHGGAGCARRGDGPTPGCVSSGSGLAQLEGCRTAQPRGKSADGTRPSRRLFPRHGNQ